MTNIKAIIFDMDGTLVDNMEYHKEAWFRFLKKYNKSLKPEEFHEKNKGTIMEIIPRFFGDQLSEDKIAELGKEKERTYRDLYRKDLKEVEGLTDLLTKMKQAGIKAALATMCAMPNIDFILDGLHIRGYFDVITGGHEVTKGKPHPEIFQITLKKLELKSDECLVIEDSAGGITSALSAGIQVVGITTSHPAEELRDAGCYHTIRDFREFEFVGH